MLDVEVIAANGDLAAVPGGCLFVLAGQDRLARGGGDSGPAVHRRPVDVVFQPQIGSGASPTSPITPSQV